LLVSRPGTLEVSLRRVEVDLDEILEQARGSDMPHVEEWMADWR
jgi:hypothetical protein